MDAYTRRRLRPAGTDRDRAREKTITERRQHRTERRARVDAALRRAFPLLQFGCDALAWVVAVPLTTWLRYDLRTGPIDEVGVLVVTLVAVLLQGLAGLGLGLYRRRYHYGSFDEVRMLAFSVAIVAAGLLAVAQLGEGGLVPRTVPMLAAFVALVIAVVIRYVARLVEDRHLRPSVERSEPIVVYGAGRSGTQMVHTLLRSSDSPYRPVALLDDDPRKARLQIDGLRVRGTGADAVQVAQRHGATAVLVAITTITGDRLREMSAPLLEAGMTVLVLPPLGEILADVGASDIRPLTVDDLLGRHPADVDLDSIAEYVTGRRVLVTGAGGSIGGELSRQLRAFDPAALILLDRDESGLHQTQLDLEGRALLDSPSLVLADIRDRERVFEAFRDHRPEVVFHAAALKHQPLLEYHPTEAWKTNVVGTHNVLEAAESTGVARLVNISTDKAADPIGVLGWSKRICERLTAATAERTGAPYVSVRFGNVLGSRGSMLGVFEQQIRDGGPVTVTDPDVTRYFMTASEAVALTIQAAAIGRPGEVLVLDMGAPVPIADVARRLIQEAGADVGIVHTGLRRGEKLHETLFGDGELDVRPYHPLISQVPVPPLDFDAARTMCSVDGRLTVSGATLALVCDAGLPRSRGDTGVAVGDDSASVSTVHESRAAGHGDGDD